jgi:hypothetical protein
MQVDNFKFYIRGWDVGTASYFYYYVDSIGDVLTTFTKTPINFAPKGWKEMKLKWERGYTYYGVFTNYTNPFEFTEDGAKILRWLYYTLGIENESEILIEKHTLTVATWGYADYYKGDLDFSRFLDKKNYVVVECMEGGLMAEIKAKESTLYEIPIEQNPDVIYVRMDGIDLVANAQWVGITGEKSIEYSATSRLPAMANVDLVNKGTNLYLNYRDNINLAGGEFKYFVRNKSTTVTQDITLNHSFNYNLFIDGSAPASGYFTLWYYIYDQDNLQVSDINIYTSPAALAPASSATYLGTHTTTISLQPNHSILYVARVYVSPGVFMPYTEWLVTQLGSTIDLNLLNKVQPTYIPAIRPITLGQNLIDKITTGYTFISDQCTTYENYVVTSGDALRGLSNSVAKTNFEDLFNAYNCMFSVAFRHDPILLKAFMDTKASVFDYLTTPYQLGEVASFEVMPLTSEMFAKLDIGYDPQNYDEINGKEEFNTKYTFQSQMKRVTNTLNLVSPYRADMYGIELTRANLDGKKEADNETDNDVFWLDIEDTSAGTVPSGYPGAGQPYYDLYRDDPTYIQAGLMSPTTAFNLRLSPKRRMNEHGYMIKSVLYPNLSQILTFASSAKTTDGGVGLEWDNGSQVYNEKDSEQVSDLIDSPYFYPVLFKIKVKIPQNILSVLNTNPYRRMSFIYKGLTLYGFLVEMSDMPAFPQEQEYRLLCSTDNTLTDLIYI